MPNTIDSGLVVTSAQLTNPFSEQTRILGEVKWATVRQIDTTRPASASTHVVSWRQSGTARTPGPMGAAGGRPAGGRSAVRAAWPRGCPSARCPLPRPAVPAGLGSGRPPLVPLSRDLPPPARAAVARDCLGEAITALPPP